MRKHLFFFLVFTGFFSSVFSQARVFEPDVISNDQVFGASFTPDGKEVYFTAAFGGRDSLQIYYSKKVKGIWEKPQPAPFSDRRLKQIDPFVSPDGKTLLFNSNPNGPGDFDVYAVYRNGDGWSVPKRLGPEINSTASDFYATMAANGNIYFTRRGKDNDIYLSRFINGSYQAAVPLDSAINAGNASNPYISPDEDYLIFFSDRPGGFGESDLYICFSSNGNWSLPQNLGSKVNTAIAEFCPGIDMKSGNLFFSRTEMVGKQRVENIYFIRLKDLNLPALKTTAKFQ